MSSTSLVLCLSDSANLGQLHWFRRIRVYSVSHYRSIPTERHSIGSSNLTMLPANSLPLLMRQSPSFCWPPDKLPAGSRVEQQGREQASRPILARSIPYSGAPPLTPHRCSACRRFSRAEVYETLVFGVSEGSQPGFSSSACPATLTSPSSTRPPRILTKLGMLFIVVVLSAP